MTDVGWIFLWSFAGFGVVHAICLIWEWYQHRKRAREHNGLTLIDHAPVNFGETVDKLCDPAFFPPAGLGKSDPAPAGDDDGWVGPHLDDCHRVPCHQCGRN